MTNTKVQDFLRTNGLVAGEEDFRRWTEDFRSEMTRGLAGAQSSLRMIPTYLSAEAISRRSEPVIVLDAGGTNLRVALVELAPDRPPEIAYFQTVPMLGTQGQLTLEQFYEGLAQLVAPIVHRSRYIGFCFSFPCEILPNLDGKILHFDKEVAVADAQGSVLGEGLRAALKRQGLPHDHRVVVINDTVAAMLGAMAQGVGGEGAYMGFILGTGTNICAGVPNETIAKIPALSTKPGSTIINLESGGFDKLARSEVDLAFDAATAAPGTQVLEKLISGAYQGDMALAYLKKAAQAGVLTQTGGELFTATPRLSAKEISQFLLDDQTSGVLRDATQDPTDRAAVLAILDAFYARAARLTAATLAAVLDYGGQARDPQKPVAIAAEGTTFYKCPLLHRYILEDMEQLAAGRLGLHSRFVQGENPNLTGAALAALAE